MNLGALKQAVKSAFASPLGWRTLGAALRARGVIVLTYHRIVGDEPSLPGVSAGRFAAQMRWVHDNCEPIRFEELVERTRTPSRGKPSVLVTFDDGYRSYHDLAYPVLKQYGIPAVVFLVTGLVDEPGVLWTDRIQWASFASRRTTLNLPWYEDCRTIHLTDRATRQAFAVAVRQYLKTIPDEERVARVDELLDILGDAPPRARQMMSWEEVRRTMDLTTYGGHTHTHCILSRLDRAGATREIATCRDRIAAETGSRPLSFAYPNGSPADYTAETKDVLREEGFEVAFCSTEGIADSESDWMAVKRLPGIDDDVPGFVWLASGLST
jgi:peptidoglycan/xylan/chitin deacetylase (PgdA/CDA1 family)